MTGTSSTSRRRRVPQGVPGHRRPEHVRRRARERDRRPAEQGRRRKGLDQSAFLGYTPTSTGRERLLGARGYINDYGIANMSRSSTTPPPPATRAPGVPGQLPLLPEPAQDYVNLFNPDVDFFSGRTASRAGPADFDPLMWGGDYTERRRWNFAFHAPQDGQGLANLYGRHGTGSPRSWTLLLHPETRSTARAAAPSTRCSRHVTSGWASGPVDQLSFHIPYIYDDAGQPRRHRRMCGRHSRARSPAATSARATPR